MGEPMGEQVRGPALREGVALQTQGGGSSNAEGAHRPSICHLSAIQVDVAWQVPGQLAGAGLEGVAGLCVCGSCG